MNIANKAAMIDTCPLCAAPARPLLEQASRLFVHCLRCDLIFVPPTCHLDAEAQRARYAKHRNSANDAGYVAMLRRSVALLRQCRPTARRVLDYGCGREEVLVGLLCEEGYQAVGYDPLYASDADMSSPFDAVVAVESFEHFAEPGGELQRIRGLLAPGGCLVVMTALHRGPDTIKGWWYARDPTHVSFYSVATMNYIAEAFGFQTLFTDNERSVVLRAGGDEAAR